MVIAKGKRITEIIKENKLYYGSKATRGIGRVLAGERDLSRVPYHEGVKIDVERPRLIYEAYKATEGEPIGFTSKGSAEPVIIRKPTKPFIMFLPGQMVPVTRNSFLQFLLILFSKFAYLNYLIIYSWTSPTF